jgi:hypothetical protein
LNKRWAFVKDATKGGPWRKGTNIGADQNQLDFNITDQQREDWAKAFKNGNPCKTELNAPTNNLFSTFKTHQDLLLLLLGTNALMIGSRLKPTRLSW